jgi:hypothetical protein
VGTNKSISTFRTLGVIAAFALVVAGCSNRDSSSGDGDGGNATVATTGAPDGSTSEPVTTDPAAGVTFGDLDSPCGPGEATIADGENGGKTLKLATPTDKGAEVAPGVHAEMYDAAIAFAEWCNDQGGISGLRIEVLDADARLFEVPAAMERVCAEAFAMVGGGWALDDQEFPRFHECDMIDIAGLTVTTAKSMSNGMVQSVPNPANLKNGLWFEWAAENYPEAITKTATAYADILTTQILEKQYIEMMNAVGGFELVDQVPYNAVGEANWAPIAQRLKNSGAETLTFIGVPETLAQLLRSMEEVGFAPELILLDGGFYAEVLIQRAGSAADGVVVRTVFRPFEEADRSRAVSDFLAMMEKYNSDGKIAALGMQATSSYLLFGTAAKACIEENAGVLDRECVVAKAAAQSGWTGGGLHAPDNPGANEPANCILLLTVSNGEWTRLWPEIDSADDAGDGFACREGSNIELSGDYGDMTAGIDPDRPTFN